MALRIKSRWHGESEKSLDEIGGALGFIAWRVAVDKAITLHGEDFVYEDDSQRMGVIAEYLIFAIQIVDRVAHESLELEQRRQLIVALAKAVANHVQDNSEDIFGPGEYRGGFFERLNQRSSEYAEFNFADQTPSYPFLRHLGHEIQTVMGADQRNRWVIDQVMDRDGPEVAKQIRKALSDLLS